MRARGPKEVQVPLGLSRQHTDAFARGVGAKDGDEIDFAARRIFADGLASVADDAFGVEQIIDHLEREADIVGVARERRAFGFRSATD